MTVPDDQERARADESAGAGGFPSEAVIAFRKAWTGPGDAATASPELLPARLTRACVAVLGVDGAGLSLHETNFRVPLGASDEVATLAERLQFTQGEGPCIDSASTRRVLVVAPAELEKRWPNFTDELFRHTPYRAVVSLPLAITRRSFAALDLFLIDAPRLSDLSLPEVSAVSDQVVDALSMAVDEALDKPQTDPDTDRDPDAERDDTLIPLWLTAAPAQARTYVWVAMGMAMTEFRLTAADALALIRSYAYGRELLIDDVASGLVDGSLNLAELRP
jgi:hypothetical protein